MSYGIVSKSTSTKMTNADAIRIAAEKMPMDFRVCEKHEGRYRIHESNPRKGAIGHNADFVLSVPGNKNCHELGIVWDEAEQCWYPAHDPYGSGRTLEEHTGGIVYEGGKLVKSHSRLMDYYKAAEQALYHRSKGKQVELTTQDDKLVLYIQ